LAAAAQRALRVALAAQGRGGARGGAEGAAAGAAGKIVRLRQKLVDAADTVKGLFGVKKQQDSAVKRLEALQARTPPVLPGRLHARMRAPAPARLLAPRWAAQAPAWRARPASPPRAGPQARMEQARAVFRDAESTEFVVVTIPTVMAAAESVRLAAALRAEKVPVRALLVNQARPARLGGRLCAALGQCTAWSRASDAGTAGAACGACERGYRAPGARHLSTQGPTRSCGGTEPYPARGAGDPGERNAELPGAAAARPAARAAAAARGPRPQARARARARPARQRGRHAAAPVPACASFAALASARGGIGEQLTPGCARGGRELQLTEAPLVDLEVRGVPALQYFGNQVWQ